MNYLKAFRNKKILITGHTGFKGSWLVLWLKKLGADVYGISNNIPTKPSLFKVLKISKLCKSYKIDVRNYEKFKSKVLKINPDYIFHLAAQSIIKTAQDKPIFTWETNFIGIMNLMKITKYLSKKKKYTLIIITSDKCYLNFERKKSYKEIDILGGEEPYGGSKASAEILFKSLVKNNFFGKNINIATARAGNVIGGGDWSQNRLIPDCVKKIFSKKTLYLRNPNATRPWQHVLESLNGYLFLAYNLSHDKKNSGQSFNFGPRGKKFNTVEKVILEIKKYVSELKFKKNKKIIFDESQILNLDSTKAKKKLGWQTVLNFKKTIYFVIEWYKYFYSKKKNIYNFSISQICEFEKLLSKNNKNKKNKKNFNK